MDNRIVLLLPNALRLPSRVGDLGSLERICGLVGRSARDLASAAIALVLAGALSPLFAQEKLAGLADVSGDAFVKEWHAPAVPPGIVVAAGHPLVVAVRFVVDPAGTVASARVVKSPDPRLNASAIKSIKSWRFTPALEGGNPVACCLDVSIIFEKTPGGKKPSLWPPSLPNPAPFAEAVAKIEPEADYPDSLLDRKLAGEVRFSGRVTAEGVLEQIEILSAVHPDFVLPALAALSKSRFAPAHRGDLAVASDLQGSVAFDAEVASRAEILKANAITAPDGSEPAVTPGLLVVVDPIWPYELLLAGKSGEATAEFEVTESGFVRDVRILSASRPEFGEALAGCLPLWRFERPIANNQTTSIRLHKRATFGGASPGAEGAIREELVDALRAGKIGMAAGLDGKLAPLYRVSPEYPQALRGSGRDGSALLELVITREGRVAAVRIVSASESAFGWAAATAFAQWVFQPPRRHGQPLDVRVQVPVKFPASAGRSG